MGRCILEPRSFDLDKPETIKRWLQANPLSTQPLAGRLRDLVSNTTEFSDDLVNLNNLSEAEKVIAQEQIIDARKQVFIDAAPLIDALFDRNKRNDTSRVAQAMEKLFDGDFEGYVADSVRVIELNRNIEGELASRLAELSRDRQVFEAVRPYLDSSPPWGRQYVRAVLEGETQPPERLIEYFRPFPADQRRLIDALLRRGSIDQAYVAFIRYLGDDPTEYLGSPYDPEFLGYPGPPPFNWNYQSQNVTRRSTGVEVNYSGERNQLLHQITPLSSGNHQFSVRMSGNASPTYGYFAWQIQCITTREMLANHEVRELRTVPTTISFPISVPSRNCPYQIIKLVGIPGSFPKSVYTEVTRISIDWDQSQRVPAE